MISLPTIISNYIQFNFWGIAMNILLTRRYSRLKTFLLFQLIILGMIFFPYILPYLSIWRAMIGLITWAAPLVLYSDKYERSWSFSRCARSRRCSWNCGWRCCCRLRS